MGAVDAGEVVNTLRVLYERRPAVVEQVPVARRDRASK
jgi:hypothetical protein